MPPTGGWRGGCLLTLEVWWISENGGQPQHWRLLQCGYHLHSMVVEKSVNAVNAWWSRGGGSEDGPQRKVRLNQLGLGLKKSQNNGVLKMIGMKGISPCAFVSDHTDQNKDPRILLFLDCRQERSRAAAGLLPM